MKSLKFPLIGLVSIIISVTLLMTYGTSANATSPATQEIRDKLTANARVFFDDKNGDREIIKLKKHHPEISFKHPSFVEHSDYKTERYHEIFINSDRKEWEVLGAGADIHYTPSKDQFSYGKRILDWTNTFDLSAVISVNDLLDRISKALKLDHPVDIADLDSHKKLLVLEQKATPIYWIDVKARALKNENAGKKHERAGRTLVFNALDGTLLLNFSKHSHAAIPEIRVKDTTKKSALDPQSTGAEITKSFEKKYSKYCQVISKNEDSLGEPLLIYPNQCNLVVAPTGAVAKPDASANRAAKNSEKTLNYYMNHFEQFGYDNDPTKNTPITSIVHIGKNLDNAYWDSELKVMIYGDGVGGSPDATRDYTYALDIAGHEFTHAVISNTANFMNTGESGALNEGFADIFGSLINRESDSKATWNFGAALFQNHANTPDLNALRSLSNPGAFTTQTSVNGKYVTVPFPDRYTQRLAQGKTCTDDNDQCEIHANSLIWSHSAYLIDEGFKAEGLSPTDADNKLGKIFFATLAHRLHENSTLKESAQEVLLTCKDLLTEKDCSIVQEAFKKAEILN